MELCKSNWQQTGCWQSIDQRKPIFTEPNSKELKATMEQYYAKIDDPNGNGAMFLAVCRGKVSEGLDFKYDYARAVIIIGLPYPPVRDPKIVLKKAFLDKNRTRENQMITGDQWYTLEATRAVNQAIGRVIRNIHDYGAILLLDNRFKRVRDYLPRWIQKHLRAQKLSEEFGPIVRQLRTFYKNNENPQNE